MDFCSACDNLLEPVHSNGNILNKCHICETQYPLENAQLFFENFTSSDAEVNNAYIRAGLNDDTYAKVEKPCPNCKAKYVKYTKGIKDLKNTYICTACNTYFT